MLAFITFPAFLKLPGLQILPYAYPWQFIVLRLCIA